MIRKILRDWLYADLDYDSRAATIEHVKHYLSSVVRAESREHARAAIGECIGTYEHRLYEIKDAIDDMTKSEDFLDDVIARIKRKQL